MLDKTRLPGREQGFAYRRLSASFKDERLDLRPPNGREKGKGKCDADG